MTKLRLKQILSFALILSILAGVCPTGMQKAKAAATATASLSKMGHYGTVTYGSKKKSGVWWKEKLNGKTAFCLSLGKTCHTGNTYVADDAYTWDQDTGGDKHGYYAKIIKWYVLDKKKSKKAFILGQALVWSVSEGRNSQSQLTDVIRQVKGNTGWFSSSTAADIYRKIFETTDSFEAKATIWSKSGGSASYQKLMTVDAEPTEDYDPLSLEKHEYYRQRVTLHKKDEDGNGLGGIQFTLAAYNIDELYSFSKYDADGDTSGETDEDDDTEFTSTGITTDSGKIAWRMTYRLDASEKYYYSDGDLAKMSSDEKKKAKKYLTEELELDEGVDFASDLKKASADKLAEKELAAYEEEIENDYTITEDNTGSNQHIVMDQAFAQGVDFTLKKSDSWFKDANGDWPDRLAEHPTEYEKAYFVNVTNKYKKATIDVVKVDKYSSDKKPHGDASLEGAEFQLYAEQACINKATVYNGDGSKKTAGVYRVSNGKLETDYLRRAAPII